MYACTTYQYSLQPTVVYLEPLRSCALFTNDGTGRCIDPAHLTTCFPYTTCRVSVASRSRKRAFVGRTKEDHLQPTDHHRRESVARIAGPADLRPAASRPVKHVRTSVVQDPFAQGCGDCTALIFFPKPSLLFCCTADKPPYGREECPFGVRSGVGGTTALLTRCEQGRARHRVVMDTDGCKMGPVRDRTPCKADPWRLEDDRGLGLTTCDIDNCAC